MISSKKAAPVKRQAAHGQVQTPHAAKKVKFLVTSFVVFALVFSVLLLLNTSNLYHSTDFEVHRNWLAITSHPYSSSFLEQGNKSALTNENIPEGDGQHTSSMLGLVSSSLWMDLRYWYREDRYSIWTLDYPPIFAFFEMVLSRGVLSSFLQPILSACSAAAKNGEKNGRKCQEVQQEWKDMINISNTKNNSSPWVQQFQRFSVILCSNVPLVFAVMVFYMASWKSSVATARYQTHHLDGHSRAAQVSGLKPPVFILGFCVLWISLHPILIMLDNIHFQYNAMIFALFTFSVLPIFMFMKRRCVTNNGEFTMYPSAITVVLTCLGYFLVVLTKHLLLYYIMGYGVWGLCYLYVTFRAIREEIETNADITKKYSASSPGRVRGFFTSSLHWVHTILLPLLVGLTLGAALILLVILGPFTFSEYLYQEENTFKKCGWASGLPPMETAKKNVETASSPQHFSTNPSMLVYDPCSWFLPAFSIPLPNSLLSTSALNRHFSCHCGSGVPLTKKEVLLNFSRSASPVSRINYKIQHKKTTTKSEAQPTEDKKKEQIIIPPHCCCQRMWYMLSESIGPILQRLFPFQRGLCHAYWAPNAYPILNVLDRAVCKFYEKRIGPHAACGATSVNTRGIVGLESEFRDASDPSSSAGLLPSYAFLPDITPRVSNLLVLLCFLIVFVAPTFLFLFRKSGSSNPTSKAPSHARSIGVKQLLWWCFGSAASFFLFGYHVHEKAIFTVLFPLFLLLIVHFNENLSLLALLHHVRHQLSQLSQSETTSQHTQQHLHSHKRFSAVRSMSATHNKKEVKQEAVSSTPPPESVVATSVTTTERHDTTAHPSPSTSSSSIQWAPMLNKFYSAFFQYSYRVVNTYQLGVYVLVFSAFSTLSCFPLLYQPREVPIKYLLFFFHHLAGWVLLQALKHQYIVSPIAEHVKCMAFVFTEKKELTKRWSQLVVGGGKEENKSKAGGTKKGKSGDGRVFRTNSLQSQVLRQFYDQHRYQLQHCRAAWNHVQVLQTKVMFLLSNGGSPWWQQYFVFLFWGVLSISAALFLDSKTAWPFIKNALGGTKRADVPFFPLMLFSVVVSGGVIYCCCWTALRHRGFR